LFVVPAQAGIQFLIFCARHSGDEARASAPEHSRSEMARRASAGTARVKPESILLLIRTKQRLSLVLRPSESLFLLVQEK
jgi:hypothetical protein